MYNQFCKNFCSYLHINNRDIYKHEYRLSILEPFYGLCKFSLYEKWKLNSDIRYYELSNLMFQIKQNQSIYPVFNQFSYELYGYGYDIQNHDGFDKKIIKDQLKLINLLLGTHYWIQ